MRAQEHFSNTSHLARFPTSWRPWFILGGLRFIFMVNRCYQICMYLVQLSAPCRRPCLMEQ